uniref:Uncharacterized protein n=1 Tax=Rhizophora mucronata TaxID=61149 RepID=A0A2P2QLW2_RHIMU
MKLLSSIFYILFKFQVSVPTNFNSE